MGIATYDSVQRHFLMAATKTKSKAKAEPEPEAKEAPAAPPPPSFEDRYLAKVFRPNLLLMAALLGVAVVLGPTGIRLLPSLNRQPEYLLQRSEIHIPEAPRWIPSGFLNQVLKQAEVTEGASVLDRDLAQRLGQAFERHPWVQGPVKVRITIPARVDVQFGFREPIGMVAINDGFYPIDIESRLLPPEDFPASEVARFPRIVAVGAPPSGSVGQAWGDERVVGAARLANVLSPHWEEFKLQSIEVPRRETAQLKYDELQYVLIAHGGSKIIWGRAPGHGHPLEVTDEQKIGRLQQFLSRGKSFDGPWEISLNHLTELTWRPLESPRTPAPTPTKSTKRRSSGR